MAKDEKQVALVRGKELLILELLSCRDKLFGLEMVEASQGGLKRGTIYVTLQRLEEKGLIKSATEERTFPEIGIPRRFYSITGYGVRVLEASVLRGDGSLMLNQSIAFAGGTL
jgi:DNA-binding PadR family transcriptional regulator